MFLAFSFSCFVSPTYFGYCSSLSFFDLLLLLPSSALHLVNPDILFFLICQLLPYHSIAEIQNQNPNGMFLKAWPPGLFYCYLALLLLFLTRQVTSQGPGENGGGCTDKIPCYQGCCSKSYNCGFGPDYCGDGCVSTCDAKSECGKYANPESFDCPLNVCCSQYGYCGITAEFCGDGCESNSKGIGCGTPSRPQCAATGDAMSFKRRIGYYELFRINQECNRFEPEELAVRSLTHINVAFVNFGDDFKLSDENADVVDRVAFLKFANPGLRVNVAVGVGHSVIRQHNIYGARVLASTHANRQTFIHSVVDYLKNHQLDGIDFDWEYPSATDRGGAKVDTTNYVTLLAELRRAFDAENPGWEISATLPTSYYYLRGFDIERMQKYVTYFGLMSYDLHGTWDHDNKFTGPFLQGHTNISEIELGLDLLWRNNILPQNVVFGLAFYGRSFTVTDPKCTLPNGKCEFSAGGRPGTCSDTSGILTYPEIASRNKSLDVHTYYDPESTVKYNVYEGSQWVSYDDEQSFFDKKKFISQRCLGGWMVWAIDQDTEQFDALSGVLGRRIESSELEGQPSGKHAETLAKTFAAYNGQNCFVTPGCTDGVTSSEDSRCPQGYSSVQTAHAPLQVGNKSLNGDCDLHEYRHICRPTNAMPKNCRWQSSSGFDCDGKCGADQFKLNEDTFRDSEGSTPCLVGSRYLCCDSTPIFNQCSWQPCDSTPHLIYEPRTIARMELYARLGDGISSPMGSLGVQMK
ncbi:hypothetical protein N7528_000039 [Penicillium herquei]|nr:hypothetical protein N7528_000039 [Penicillium herquei]